MPAEKINPTNTSTTLSARSRFIVPSSRSRTCDHAEQVAQDIGCDAGHANQHGAVVEIVVGHVVNIWSRCKQFGTVVEVNPNRKRTRISRTMSRHARQQFSTNLERG